ncbi:MAG: hypothetical protein N2512_02740 [Armatimonadetes bacterium]|nr:hypothetical protein [Armatimonadota bacterium]
MGITSRRGPGFRVTYLAAAIGVLSTAGRPGWAVAFTVADLPRVRCVSNYLFGEQALDPAAWQRDLDRMKENGFNTVWVVNVWADYEPRVEPEQWREDRVERLREICAAAQARDMWVALALAYVGEGWGPEGLDVPVWPLLEDARRHHLAFLRRMAAATANIGNVFYLLCTEEILPATLLYRPNERAECVESFRRWARDVNPDINYWNGRWGAEYTWETLTPVDIEHRPRWQLWADHQRWCGWLMRQIVPPMVAAVREGNPNAVVGLHDFLVPIGLDLTAADGALPLPSPCDFYSIGYYYDHGLAGGLEANLAALREKVQATRQLYPDVPLFCGELGLDVRKQPAADRQRDEELQAQFLAQATDHLRKAGAGFSIWGWRTVVAHEPRTHSLIREDGTDTPALTELRKHFLATRH